MRRWKYLALGILAVFLVRVEHTGDKIDTMEPVETVRIRKEEGCVIIDTDTQAKGYGESLGKAIENLHSSAQAVVFLEAANYILLGSGTEELIPELYQKFRPNTLVCGIKGDADLKEITKYLKIHQPNKKLLHLEAGDREIQTLYYKEGRGQLVG